MNIVLHIRKSSLNFGNETKTLESKRSWFKSRLHFLIAGGICLNHMFLSFNMYKIAYQAFKGFLQTLQNNQLVVTNDVQKLR